MPVTPADGHSTEFEQLAGLAALDVLEGDELARFDQHAAQCERCRLMVRLDREALALIAPPMDPSPGFKERLMQRAAAELAAQGSRPEVRAEPAHAEPIPMRPRATPANVIPFWRRSTWMSSLAAVLVLGLVAFGAYSYENQPVATYELTGSGPGGRATVIVRRSGAAELDINGMPDPPPGFVYEAWVIPQGSKPIAAGIASRGEAKLPLPDNARGSTIAITREPGRVEIPTGEPFLVTVVQS